MRYSQSSAYSVPKYLGNYPPPANKKWPQDIQCVIRSSNPNCGSLYISNVEAAQNPATVKKLRVGAILTCAKGYKVSHPRQLVPYYMYIEGEDKESFNISEHFDSAVKFIDENLKKTNMIVHCIAGVSRSVSMVIAYLIKVKQMTYNEAFYEVKSKRKIICPNEGFITHLKEYQRKLGIKDRRASYDFSPKKQPYDLTINGNSANKLDGHHTMIDLSTPQKQPYVAAYDRVESMHRNPESSYKDYSTKASYYQRQNPEPQNLSKTAYGSFTSYKQRPNSAETFADYRNFSKSMNLISDNTASNENSNLKSNNSVSLNRVQGQSSKKNDISQKRRGGYFDAMNDELNEKIEAIRKKYQNQREEMLSKYNTRSYSSKKDPIVHSSSQAISTINDQQKYSAPENKHSHTIDSTPKSSYSKMRPITQRFDSKYLGEKQLLKKYTYNTPSRGADLDELSAKLDSALSRKYETLESYGQIDIPRMNTMKVDSQTYSRARRLLY